MTPTPTLTLALTLTLSFILTLILTLNPAPTPTPTPTPTLNVPLTLILPLTPQGMTPIMYAAASGALDSELLLLLVSALADVHATDYFRAHTLHHAAAAERT